MAPFKNEYKFSLIIIQTRKNEVFGAFIDDVARKYLKGYIGSNDCFVFSLKPEVKCYLDTSDNQRYFLGEDDYFQIGGEG